MLFYVSDCSIHPAFLEKINDKAVSEESANITTPKAIAKTIADVQVYTDV